MAAPPRSPISSSDDEYFEIIDGINTEQEGKQEEKEPIPDSTNQLVPESDERMAAADVEEVFNDSEEAGRYEKRINEKDDRINELTEELGEKDEQVKKYSSLLAPFKHQVQQSIDGFDSDFYLSVSDVFLGLIVAIFSSTGIGYLLALGFTLKGLVYCTCAEMSKKKSREVQTWLQTDFPEAFLLLNSSPLTSESVAIDMSDPTRTVTLAVGSGRGYGIFDYWGSGSIGFVRSSSIADAQGIRRGDQIISVDGTSLDTLPHAEVEKLYDSAIAAGRTSLVVQHNPERLSEIESTVKRFVFVAAVAIVNLIILQFKLW